MSNRDLAAELDSDTGAHPESWKPAPGDKLVGRVVRYDKAPGRYGPCVLAVLDVAGEGGKASQGPHLVAVWLAHKVLLELFKDLRPAPGEMVGIKRVDDSGKGYARYLVKVDRPEIEPVWEAMALPEHEEDRE